MQLAVSQIKKFTAPLLWHVSYIYSNVFSYPLVNFHKFSLKDVT